ncbi:MAG: hypothetical protein H0T76_07395 [Nannocystis sp.]|nr:hypothetical protein [Nannocystis sp.]
MLLIALLRPLVALSLIAPAPAVPVVRDYGGADAPEAATSESEPGPVPEAPVVPEAPAAVAPEPAADADPIPEGPVEEEADVVPYDPMVDSPEAIRARHWIRSGVVFMVLGSALSIGGIAMARADVNNPDTGDMSCDPRSDPAGNGCTAGGRRRAALALGLPGAGLLAGGIAMLVVGKRQQKRLAANLHADRRGFFIGAALRF